MPRAVEDGIRMKCEEERILLEEIGRKTAGFRLREHVQPGGSVGFRLFLFWAVQGLGCCAGYVWRSTSIKGLL